MRGTGCNTRRRRLPAAAEPRALRDRPLARGRRGHTPAGEKDALSAQKSGQHQPSTIGTCILTGLHEPTGIFWANITSFLLQFGYHRHLAAARQARSPERVANNSFAATVRSRLSSLALSETLQNNRIIWKGLHGGRHVNASQTADRKRTNVLSSMLYGAFRVLFPSSRRHVSGAN